MAFEIHFEEKSAGAGAKCDHHKMKVRTRARCVRATQKMVATHALKKCTLEQKVARLEITGFIVWQYSTHH